MFLTPRTLDISITEVAIKVDCSSGAQRLRFSDFFVFVSDMNFSNLRRKSTASEGGNLNYVLVSEDDALSVLLKLLSGTPSSLLAPERVARL